MAILAPAIPSIIASLAISAAAYVAETLLTPKQRGLMADNSPTVLTERGSFIPRVIGRRRVNGFLVWAGDRKISSKGGGGKGGGGGGGGANEYSERGWQILSIGPAHALYKIVEGGKVIWEGSITPTTAPSGTQLTTKSGNLYIYWGEADQPIDPILAGTNGPQKTEGTGTWVWGRGKETVVKAPGSDASDGIGVSSRWPCFCYVVWDRHNNGGSPQWPVLEYELEVRVQNPVLTDSSAWLNEQTAGDLTDGPNPAHVLWELLTAPSPWGFGIDESNLDREAFEALGTLLETEHQTCHLLATDGITGIDLIAQILTDCGVVMPQVGEVLSPAAVRPVDPATLAVVPTDLSVLPHPPNIQIVHDAALPSRILFTIKDRRNAFRDVPIVSKDDGLGIAFGNSKPMQVDIPTVIERRTALKVVDRRTLELLTNPQQFQLTLAREPARLLRPGMAFILDGFAQLRVATMNIQTNSRTASLTCLVDQYSGQVDSTVPPGTDDDYNIEDTLPPADADVLDIIQELPLGMSVSPSLGIMRIRANTDVIGAYVWASATGSSYERIGSQDAFASGGTIQAAVPADGPAIIDELLITPYNADLDNVLDLSSDEDSWRSGAQIAIIDGEVFFLKRVTIVDANTWALQGLIRARYDTFRDAYPVGTPIVFMAANKIKPLETSLIRPLRTFYVKVQPYTSETDVLDLSSAPAIPYVVGYPRVNRPLPCDNFVANRGLRINEYSTGQDIVFTFNYRVMDGNGSEADGVDAGTPIGAKPTHDGHFLIRIWSGAEATSTVLRGITIDDDTGTATYTNAQLVADFGGEPASFVADLGNVVGSYTSALRIITVTKV